ncbi:SitI3 family protein [Catenuloplanes indicus]|uniref:SitI3 family protein n=1 Tax=Catenuloplanes indicus TaxID=137267 RepID=UPI0027D90180|nr:SitI3 family protein [Catenuloplanes indicus]
MGIEYRLTLAGAVPADEVAMRAMPEVADRPVGSPALLSADLYDSHGFFFTIVPRKRGSVAAEADDGMWTWDLSENVMVSFDMDKFDEAEQGERALAAMLVVVGRVLGSGDEDAALTLNGDVLLLTRLGGVTAKHSRAAWWEHHAAIGDIIQG